MKQLNGIGVSSGISIAKVFILKETNSEIIKRTVTSFDEEIAKFNCALTEAKKQIEKLKENAKKSLGKKNSEIFDAHNTILEDPELLNGVESLIKDKKVNASFAIKEISEQFRQIFLSMDDEYMRERAADIFDVTSRVINILEGIAIQDLSLINKEVIIIAHDLTPSQTSQLKPEYIKGFVTEIGGKTSHSAIMARSLGIPAIVGVGKNIFDCENDSTLLIDGKEGAVIFNPDERTSSFYNEKNRVILEWKKEIQKFKDVKTQSLDGWKTKIAANIGSPKDLKNVLNVNSDGVGLFRTEFLYMDSKDWPTEEEQFSTYKEVLTTLKNQKVVFRTLDIGGDKKLDYYKFPYEMNPFLGNRAIRFQLTRKDVMDAQVRALLRASIYGEMAINIPMISTIEEIKKVRSIFEKIKKDLIAEGCKVGKYELGIMVEVPSVVELIDKFVKYVDFFSIGTNDLIQYTFASDRMSEKTAYLYQPLNPAILKKIKKVIDASHAAGKWTAVCGESTSDPMIVPIFVGLGLDEFSMTSSAILKNRYLISKINKKKAEKLAEQALALETEEEVISAVKMFLDEENIKII